MTTSISERANAYRAALRQGLNDGRTIKSATDLAKKAARECSNNFPEPPMGPVELTDEELRLIDESELTADECDRLDELDQAAVNAEERAFNDTLPKGIATWERDRDSYNEDEATKEGDYCSNCGIPHQIHGDECGQEAPKASLHGSITAVNKSDVVKELAEALGYRVVEIPLSDVLSLDNADTDLDEGDDPDLEDYMTDALGQNDELDIRTHELMEEACGQLLKAPGHIQLTIDARRAAKLEGNCEEGYEEPECKEPSCVNNRMWAKRRAIAAEKKLRDHGDEPVDMGDFGAGTLADAWRDAVGIDLGGIITPAGLRIKAKAAFMAGLGEDLAAEKGYVDYGEDLSHEEKVAAGMSDCVGDNEGCQCPDCREQPRCVSGFPGPGVLADLAANKKPRDCDIPATLRAIELYGTEDHGSTREWFDGDAEMHQFLCALKVSVYAGADQFIRDQEGEVVGVWFYAHFGPTPVS